MIHGRLCSGFFLDQTFLAASIFSIAVDLGRCPTAHPASTSTQASVFAPLAFSLDLLLTTVTPLLFSPPAWSEILPLLASPLGALAFVPLYAIWVTLLLPGVWASMLAGALYGTWWGSLLVFVGACLGAEIVFLLGRGRLRGWARRRLAAAPKLLAVEQAVSREGLRLVLLTRLSPAFPFSLLNLAYGLSEVSLRDYTIGLIGILPGTVLFCALGALAGDVTRFNTVLAGQADPLTWVVRILGIAATVAVTLLVTRVARRALADGQGGALSAGEDPGAGRQAMPPPEPGSQASGDAAEQM
jgi:uncharacterized membrane protein YdjX (TVP38/TMEM64 family)